MAPFIDNVSDYVSSRAEVESTLRSFQEMISKYQFMEVNTQRRGQGLREKIPDIKKTLEMVRFLKLRKEVRRRPYENICRTLGSKLMTDDGKSPTRRQTSKQTSNSMIPSTLALRFPPLMPRRYTSGLARMSCWRIRWTRRRPCCRRN